MPVESAEVRVNMSSALIMMSPSASLRPREKSSFVHRDLSGISFGSFAQKVNLAQWFQCGHCVFALFPRGCTVLGSRQCSNPQGFNHLLCEAYVGFVHKGIPAGAGREGFCFLDPGPEFATGYSLRQTLEMWSCFAICRACFARSTSISAPR